MFASFNARTARQDIQRERWRSQTHSAPSLIARIGTRFVSVCIRFYCTCLSACFEARRSVAIYCIVSRHLCLHLCEGASLKCVTINERANGSPGARVQEIAPPRFGSRGDPAVAAGSFVRACVCKQLTDYYACIPCVPCIVQRCRFGRGKLSARIYHAGNGARTRKVCQTISPLWRRRGSSRVHCGVRFQHNCCRMLMISRHSEISI